MTDLWSDLIMDDFESGTLEHEKWSFVNMGSPGNLTYNVTGQSTIILEEKNLNHDGHGLISKMYLNKNNSFIETKIIRCDVGGGIAFYGGDGCWDHYILFAVIDGILQVRIPSGAQNGDAFLWEGQPKYIHLYQADFQIEFPVLLKLQRQGFRYSCFCNGELLAVCEYQDIRDHARAIIKCIGADVMGDTLDPSQAELDYVKLGGLASTCTITGTIRRQDGEAIPEANIHIAGHDQYFINADGLGNFRIHQAPKGRLRLVAAAEGYLFNSLEVDTIDQDLVNCKIILIRETQENIPRGEYNCPEFDRSGCWNNLNGTWLFDFDELGVGEQQEWYLLARHCFQKVIRVPFSWSSLNGFGEEYAVNGKTMHVANPFFNNHQLTGENGWYQKSFIVPADFPKGVPVILKIGACSSVTKVWCDGNFVGIGSDQFGRTDYNLGRLEPGSQHNLTIRVIFPYDKYAINLGKQLFWFNQSPGIWQTIWIEPREDYYINSLKALPELEFEQGQCIKATVVVEAAMRVDGGQVYTAYDCGEFNNINKNPISSYEQGAQNVDFYIQTPAEGLYQLSFQYSAPEGSLIRIIYINDQIYDQDFVFPATLGWEICRSISFTVFLEKGINIIQIRTSNKHQETKLNLENLQVIQVPEGCQIEISVFDPDNQLIICEKKSIIFYHHNFKNTGSFTFDIETPRLWDIGQPELYHFTMELIREDGRPIDEVGSYFGLRKIETHWAPGHSPKDTHDQTQQYKYLYLNGRPFYMLGVLDQGYNPWGIYTYDSFGPDSKKGSVMYDIKMAKQFGYNTIRMHIKENEPLWYHYCDKIGMLVWNEHPSNEFAVADNPKWMGIYEKQLRNMVERRYNNPSIIINSTINESWGIEGCQLSSPWKNKSRQMWQKKMALLAKTMDQTRLICDNSGFGKTEATDIIDYHSYPDCYETAKTVFGELSNASYPGSTYNFYNATNGSGFLGSEVQAGQPVILSEFNHTNGIETMVRTFPKFAGVIRMNIASQEFEDTSPLTYDRFIRNLGYVDRELTNVGYKVINSSNLLIIDKKRIEVLKANSYFETDIYMSCFERNDFEQVSLFWKVKGIDNLGNIIDDIAGGRKVIDIPKYGSSKVAQVSTKMPDNINGGWLFVWAEVDNRLISESYIQFVLTGSKPLLSNVHQKYLSVSPADFTVKDWDKFDGVENNYGKSIVWGKDNGFYEYHLSDLSISSFDEITHAEVICELAARDCINAVNVTDEIKTGTKVRISLNNMIIAKVDPEDDPFDEKALFTNALLSEGTYCFKKLGRFGYGYRYALPLQKDILKQLRYDLKKDPRITLKFESFGGGLTLYGKGTGRFGIDPMLVLHFKSCHDEDPLENP